MNCPACGTDNRDAARFCRRCGTALTKTPVPPEPAPPETSVPPGTPLGSREPAPPETSVPPGTPPEPEEPALTETPPEGEAPAGQPGVGQAQEQAEPASPGDTKAEEAAPAPSPPAEAAPVPPADAAPGSPAEATPDRGESQSTGGVDTPPIPPEQADAPGEPEPEAALVPEPDAFWREETAPLEPAPAGTVLDGRYALGEVLDIQGDSILYQARDLHRCWHCGFDGNSPSEAFCGRCGAALERKPGVRILEVRDAETEPAGSERVVARLLHDGRTFLVLAEPELPPLAAAPSTGAVRLVVGQRSVPGQVRDLNEDSLLILTMTPVFQSKAGPAISLFAVADGMGGHEGGEIASKLALQALAGGIVQEIALPSLAGQAIPDDGILSRLQQTVAAANDAVYLARQKRNTDMGTTLTVLLVCDQQLFLAHVGDCRAFRWNASGLEQLTADHSLVAAMVARGQITADEIYTHPQRSVVYRSIGDRPTVDIDTSVWPLAPGDRLIVCSDGLWEMLRNEGIQDGMMAEADPQAACDLLVSRANAAGGDDNISVVVVEVVRT